MSKKLYENVNSRYFEAANAMKAKDQRRRIVAYVESYDDVFFWRMVLGALENDKRYFEVMLPARKEGLGRGKKSALMSVVDNGSGKDMIACVDADYDYLLQGASPTSRKVLKNPYVFHTYVYAIENFQCYAPSLHDLCVMVTLNDHRIFDFEGFFKEYSEICYPLFVWSVWAYRSCHYGEFSISDYCKAVELGGMDVQKPQLALAHLRQKVQRKVLFMQRHYPSALSAYETLKKELSGLGVTPQNTYLYMQGHHLMDAVVTPLVIKVCNRLRLERESEIHRTAIHRTQMYNEMACYENSLDDVKRAMKRNQGYARCEQFLQIRETIQNRLDENAPVSSLSSSSD
ncbi:MAG: DUF4435 domain-containing protein [Prevotella sp.]